ncbi:DUF1272 domain-containing protein [Arenicella sp. 4NH20-0111]|uniref:DUF1272 domain-containing protein n=1 Tax=Arenicella sp. 4NH20-0111 TaxID=3127648 RepID=UPI003340E6B7
MLVLKPNCEWCDKDLLANATDAMICSYECTFCRECVEQILNNVCPNCGGGLCERPIRPQKPHRKALSLIDQPAATERVNTPYSKDQLADFINTLKKVPPNQR